MPHKEETKVKKRKLDSGEPVAANSTSDADEKAQRKAEKREKKRAKLEQQAAENESEEALESKAERKARKAEKKRLRELAAAAAASPVEHEAKQVEAAPGAITGYQESAALTAMPKDQVDKFLESNMINVSDPRSTTYRPIMEFSHLPQVVDTQTTLFKGFKAPTPIQSASWPYLLAGRDMVGVAQTGSGKTLAFGLPSVRFVQSGLASKKQKTGRAKVVVVSPTRELAQQIYDQYEKLVPSTGVSVVCVYGGIPKDAQRAALAKAHIIIATPGRLNDFIQEGAADLSQVGYLVLDEADRMLDKGFEQEIRKIISGMPAEKQTLMFTATWPQSIRELAATFMKQPVKITIGDTTGELRANTQIKQIVEVVEPRGKEWRLLELLRQHQSGKNKDDRILVFCLYKKEASRVEGFLSSKGMRVAGIHGDMTQPQRTQSLEAFKSGKCPLLVATDVAARGLDIPAVKVVINVTFPLTTEDYVHRIGRTGRAGAEGLSITLFTEHDKAQSGA